MIEYIWQYDHQFKKQKDKVVEFLWATYLPDIRINLACIATRKKQGKGIKRWYRQEPK